MKNKLQHSLSANTILLIGFSFIITTFTTQLWQKKGAIINWDMGCYHLYLPAQILYHDLSYLTFYPSIHSNYHPKNQSSDFGIVTHPNLKKTIKYTYGVALFELPGFLIAAAYCYLTNIENDGHSAPFQLAICLSTILFGLLALWIMKKSLLKFFDEWVTSLTLAVLSVGTNIFFYCTIEPGLSHIYLFFCYSTILYLTIQLIEIFNIKKVYYLCLMLGITILIRPTDGVLVLVPLITLLSTKSFINQISFKLVMIGLGLFILPLIPQLFYWKITSGQWLFYSYTNERFNFNDPHIYDGLFSYRKGWLFYSPLVILGFLGLPIFWLNNKNHRTLTASIIVFFLFSLYITFSWYDWAYGGSFGCRSMLQTLALLALPLGALVAFIKQFNKAIRYFLMTVIVVFITFNLFQTWQYYNGFISVDNMNEAQYKYIFLRTHW
jgi:hypothetical protein